MFNTQLYVKLDVRKADNTAIVAASQVGPVNLLLHSLFSEVDVKLNDVLITSTNNTYAYRAYLETLLTYGSESKTTQLSSSLYEKDTPDKMDDADDSLQLLTPVSGKDMVTSAKEKQWICSESSHGSVLSAEISTQRRYYQNSSDT